MTRRKPFLNLCRKKRKQVGQIYEKKKTSHQLQLKKGHVCCILIQRNHQLKDRKEILAKLISQISELKSILLSLDLTAIIDAETVSTETKGIIVNILLKLLNSISTDATIIRSIKSKKEYTLTKFIERGGSEWRQTKFAYVISAIKAFLFDIQKYLDAHVSLLGLICQFVAHIQGSKMYVQSTTVHLFTQSNYRLISENQSKNDKRKVKQRSEVWIEERKWATVTGSSIFEAVGLDGLKKLQHFFDGKMCSEKAQEPSDIVMNAMRYGTENEINAVATFCGKVLPVIAPSFNYHEEGYIRKEIQESEKFMVISPDGSVVDSEMNVVSAVEFKCPVSGIAPHKELPVRYFLQCQAAMDALNVSYMCYVCWRPETSTVFVVYRDDDVFQSAISIVLEIFGSDKPKRPGALHALELKIEEGQRKSIFIGEFPSASYTDSPILLSMYFCVTVKEGLELCDKLCSAVNEGCHLQREKATGAVVVLCSDLDRWYGNIHCGGPQ